MHRIIRLLPASASDCVGALGFVDWNPKRPPFGPTYGVFDGKPVPQFPVDHVDIWFPPHGKPPDFVSQDR